MRKAAIARGRRNRANTYALRPGGGNRRKNPCRLVAGWPPSSAPPP
ncbi:hypothetical protein A33M_1004 [Rhodovulum sp. PH10]|nr:hypothetical protein A33M_1004 [Rhodovulum sp. PH10]